jgi:two-component system, NarL family, response regulator LiaR
MRIFVIDDHPIVRTGLAAMLGAGPEIEWVGEAGNGVEGIPMACAAQADVVLMDLMLPGMDGIETTRELLRRRPEVRVVMISSRVTGAEVQRALDAGALGYVTKTVSARELAEVLRSVHAGRQMLSADAAAAVEHHC